MKARYTTYQDTSARLWVYDHITKVLSDPYGIVKNTYLLDDTTVTQLVNLKKLWSTDRRGRYRS